MAGAGYRPRSDESWKPPTALDKPRRVPANYHATSDSHSRRSSRNLSQRPAKKTRRVRLTNPSTRIHSLRNLLQRDSNLPPAVRQERERELAALLLEQETARLKQAQKKNLEKYHFVRFIERKKAERVLKKLKARKERGDLETEDDQKTIDNAIHEAEVDWCYTQYAPLGEKYISIFAEDGEATGKVDGNARGDRNDKLKPPRMDTKIHGELTDGQQQEPRNFEDEQCNVLRTAREMKPPMWYEVEKCMAQGQAKLEALRRGKLTTGIIRLDKELVSVGGKEKVSSRRATAKRDEQKPSSLDDLDSDKDEEMSDGGFFER